METRGRAQQRQQRERGSSRRWEESPGEGVRLPGGGEGEGEGRGARALAIAVGIQIVMWAMVAIALPIFFLPTYQRTAGEEGESEVGLSPPYSAFVASIWPGIAFTVDYGLLVALGMFTAQLLWSLMSFTMGKSECPHATQSQSPDSRDTTVAEIFGLAFVSWVAGALVWWILIVLFGASLVESLGGTARLALLASSLTAVPLSSSVASASSWRAVLEHSFAFPRPSILLPSEMAWTIGVAVIFGTWAGAFPIPLDWDREWQTWPLPCVFGALAGHLLGLVACVVRWAVESAIGRVKTT